MRAPLVLLAIGVLGSCDLADDYAFESELVFENHPLPHLVEDELRCVPLITGLNAVETSVAVREMRKIFTYAVDGSGSLDHYVNGVKRAPPTKKRAKGTAEEFNVVGEATLVVHCQEGVPIGAAVLKSNAQAVGLVVHAPRMMEHEDGRIEALPAFHGFLYHAQAAGKDIVLHANRPRMGPSGP